jgi:hypothetical protein
MRRQAGFFGDKPPDLVEYTLYGCPPGTWSKGAGYVFLGFSIALDGFIDTPRR